MSVLDLSGVTPRPHDLDAELALLSETRARRVDEPEVIYLLEYGTVGRGPLFVQSAHRTEQGAFDEAGKLIAYFGGDWVPIVFQESTPGVVAMWHDHSTRHREKFISVSRTEVRP